MKEENVAPFIIGGLVVLIVLLCAFVPGFAGAVVTTLECAFSPYTCVRVLP